MKKILDAIASFSLTARIIFYGLGLIFVISGFSLLWRLNNHFLVLVPKAGGALTEGVIGLPQFINPVLAVTNADKDLTALVYSGLLRYGPRGNLIPDLAESYTISPDGLTYDFILKKNALWSDGKPVTADDVVFTIQKIQDPAIKSVEAANWQNVTVKKIAVNEVQFILKQPYAPFIENTTIGILPEHLWSSVSDDAFASSPLNVSPVGSGVYKIASTNKTSSGIPVSDTLSAFNKFVLGAAYIRKMTIKFYSDETSLVQAYENHDVDEINSISPAEAYVLSQQGAIMVTSTLPRVFGVFFNQNKNPVLADVTVRQALDMSIDRVYDVDIVLQGFGEPLHGPVPPDFFALTSTSSTAFSADSVGANNLLDKDGWKLDGEGIREKQVGKQNIPLAFSISTPDNPELVKLAETLESEWKAIGADVSVKIFQGGYLDQNVIEPRNYDALLFGEELDRGLDLFPFWHSSQTSAPGLNVALYSNKQADTILQALRVTEDTSTRNTLYQGLAQDIQKDIPAVFIYAPDFIYVMRQDVHMNALREISDPSDRFSTIYTWYIDTEKIWKIFIHH